MKKLLVFVAIFCSLLLTGPLQDAHAAELTPNLKLSTGGSTANLTDTSHYTTVTLQKEDTITVTSSDGSPIYGLYISWDTPVASWTLTTDSVDLTCGTQGFLHEYIALDTPSSSLTIHIPAASTKVDGIRIFSEGELPHDVQVWNPPCERADIMVVSSHSDDEILFMGGALTLYAYEYDADIQVVYMCEFRSTGQAVREHEKLDGLWEAGIRFYPTCGNFYDKYCNDLAHAHTLYSYDDMTEFLVKQIRDSKPQVIVTHDIFGEYGHGYHILTCRALLNAIDLASVATEYPESAEAYGVWDTPKTYLHLHNVNAIKLDLRTPIEEDYAGRTALDILKAAYKKHVSQQRYRFYVSDDYEHSCADYGLYRSLVGRDTTNDLLCNITTYKVQEAEEAARLEAERIAEAERLAAEEAARLEAERIAIETAQLEAERLAEEERLAAEEAARLEAERLAEEEAKRLEKERLAQEKAEQEAAIESLLAADQKKSEDLQKAKTLNIVLISCSVVCFLAAAGLLLKLLSKKH